MSASHRSNITVSVRVRPLTPAESAKSCWPTVELLDGQHVKVNDPDDKMGGIDYLRLGQYKTKNYAFDYAFGPDASQEEVYAATAKPLAAKAVQGYNACCFAYGATGAGKTFTMMGSFEQMGVIPLTLEEVARMTAADDEAEYKISMQYIEIYNEKIKDLLQPSDAVLEVREVPSKGTYVAGAADRVVNTPRAMMELIHQGNLHRTTEATGCNEVSSRSHAVLQLTVRSKARYDASATRVGKLSMIDLAGSERQTKTGNRGARLTEGANINRSLLALGNCINALADRTRRVTHVPFRDSKLTRLLKDSLGGKCLTAMIANVSPSHDQFDETLNSLKYANRAKNIKPRDDLPIVVNVQREEAAPVPPDVLSELEMLKHKLRSTVGNTPVRAAPFRSADAPSANGAEARRGGAAGKTPGVATREQTSTPELTMDHEMADEAVDGESEDDAPHGGKGGRLGAKAEAEAAAARREAQHAWDEVARLQAQLQELRVASAATRLPMAQSSSSGPQSKARKSLPASGTEPGRANGALATAERWATATPAVVAGRGESGRSRGEGLGGQGPVAEHTSSVAPAAATSTHAAATQPRALQMYQMLDLMEEEDAQAIEQESKALLHEHVGLLDDYYDTLLRLICFSTGSRGEHTAVEAGGHNGEAGARDGQADEEELDEQRASILAAIEANRSRMIQLVRDLPSRIVSVQRLQVLRLSLQNTAMCVLRAEREAQAVAVRKGMGQLLQAGGADGEGGSAPQAVLLDATQVQRLLRACEGCHGGGEELLQLVSLVGDTQDAAAAEGADDDGEPPANEASAEDCRSPVQGVGNRLSHLSLAAVVPALLSTDEDGVEGAEALLEQISPSPCSSKRRRAVGEIVREAATRSSRASTPATPSARPNGAKVAGLEATGLGLGGSSISVPEPPQSRDASARPSPRATSSAARTAASQVAERSPSFSLVGQGLLADAGGPAGIGGGEAPSRAARSRRATTGLDSLSESAAAGDTSPGGSMCTAFACEMSNSRLLSAPAGMSRSRVMERRHHSERAGGTGMPMHANSRTGSGPAKMAETAAASGSSTPMPNEMGHSRSSSRLARGAGLRAAGASR